MSVFSKNRKRLRKQQEEARKKWTDGYNSTKEHLEGLLSMSKKELDTYLNGYYECKYNGK